MYEYYTGLDFAQRLNSKDTILVNSSKFVEADTNGFCHFAHVEITFCWVYRTPRH